jgi:NAD(P)-dependent dehydrogenase (short-subunit alcohol dehydrogenase family)
MSKVTDLRVGKHDELEGRVAVVTGGSKGLGKGIAECLSEAGARIVIASTDAEAGERTAAELPGEATMIVTDVSRADSVAAMAERVGAEFGGVDILVNNAGVNTRPMLLQDVPEEEWDRLMGINLRGVYLVCRALIPQLIESGHGRLINISSILGQSGYPQVAPYVASKFAVNGLTQSLAHELGPHRVTANTIHPGMVETEMNVKIVAVLSEAEGRSEEEVWNTFRDGMPLGSLQTARDIGEMAAFLASDRATNITGAAFNVDGGAEMH